MDFFFLTNEYQTQVISVYADNLPDLHKCLGFERVWMLLEKEKREK